ncbi:MAG: HAMP domain-containing histidine kinase, partial [Rhodococcus sp.]|nr:HAMP domain-containing histidine kinase [Rhodococcus sp. (in: high G+C Gram-positive bacteria)]
MVSTPLQPSRGAVWRTLRFRLAAWNAAVVIVTALVTLIGLRQGVRWALVHELDQVLVDDVHEIELAIRSVTTAGRPALREGLTRMAEGHERRGWYVALFGEDGESIWFSPDAPARAPTLPLERNQSPISFDGFRVVRQPLSPPVDGVGMIQVGATLEHIRADMARIDQWVLLAAGAVLLTAPLCGYWLASRAARTIGDIITTAATLRPIRLGEHLAIRGSGDELDMLALTINGLLDRIAVYVDSKRDFLANAAHELRTPLAAIRSSVEVALNGERSPEEYEDLMVDVIEECGALEALVNQLLLLAETEADLPTARMEPVDLSVLASKSVDMFTGVADARGIELITGRLEPAIILGNAAHLRQVLNNLIDNAVKYTHQGGRVTTDVTVDAAQQQVELRVNDTGQGLTPTEQQH